MKLKSLFLALLVMLSGVVMAQVNSGKVYRIVNSKYGTVITASPVEHKLRCVEKGTADDYQQMWEFTYDADKDKYSITINNHKIGIYNTIKYVHIKQQSFG